MSQFRFDQPQWIHLVWAVIAFVAVLIWLDHRGTAGLDRFLSIIMQQRLVSRPKRFRRVLRILLLGACGVFLVLALMRPQAGLHRVQTPRVGAQLMVCLDVSKSMLAEDVRPNRLRRAKAEVLDLMTFLEKDHIGLIAFAGKATVLCPLTPDFSFLRQVIEAAGPDSVVRGGTNLEAPIRKALEGFRGQSDLSRVVILITDGEDHDSFPEEAAKAAAEKGVCIITIGFGDEAGSEIQITDPQTGGRTTLLDADGRPVVTKLDGNTLRKIAVETGGVYVPAGTGMLDLKAIYDTHIAPLTRGRLEDSGRLVIQEQFQWPILLALCCLIAAVTVASGRPRPPAVALSTSAVASVGAIAVLLVLAMHGTALGADPETVADEPVQATELEEQKSLEDIGAHTTVEPDKPVNARVVYNDALALLTEDDLDEAETQFSLVRRHSGADGLARFSATYNLGWVEVTRANQFRKENPQQALTHLHAAAEWFREAVRLQPDEERARENLEVVGRCALELADALAREEQVDVAAQIDQLIVQQRELTVRLQGVVQRVESLKQTGMTETLRNEFRALEVEQRQIMSRLDEVSQYVRDEIERIDGIEQAERTPEQGLRLAQLQYVQAYLYQASQRVGQTRRHLRGRQAQRAYRRASVALGQLKRARDQLRDLVEVLGAVIVDGTEMTKQSLLFASDTMPSFNGESKEIETPLWLTREFLGETLATIQQRTDELVARVEAGLASENVDPEDEGTVPVSVEPSNRDADAESDQAHLRAMLSDADPLIRGAVDHFRAADEARQSERDLASYQSNALGMANLMQARELFLDIRPLIELIHVEQNRLQVGLEELEKVEPGKKTVTIRELVEVMPQIQAMNTKRGRRLGGLLDRELEQVRQAMSSAATQPAPVPGAPTAGAGGDQTEAIQAEAQQLELARELQDSVLTTFGGIERLLGRMSTEPPGEADLGELRQGVDLSVEQIESLRRLFFSLIEHLQETLRRQVEVADGTRDVVTLTADDQDRQRRLGPLAGEQQQLSMISKQIVESLQKQSEQPSPQTDPAAGDPKAAQASQEAADRLRRAAGYVGDARLAMEQAHGMMASEPADLEHAQEHHTTAIEKLAEALQLLTPPPPPEQPEQQEQQPEQAGEGGGQKPEPEPQANQGQDMSRLLQAVRDRDAQRQREKRNRQQSGYAPVEKDW